MSIYDTPARQVRAVTFSADEPPVHTTDIRRSDRCNSRIINHFAKNESIDSFTMRPISPVSSTLLKRKRRNYDEESCDSDCENF
jgi:hypothetical protein